MQSRHIFSLYLQTNRIQDNILASPHVEEDYDNKCKQACDHRFLLFTIRISNPTIQMYMSTHEFAKTQHLTHLKKKNISSCFQPNNY